MLHFPLSLMNRLNKTESAIFNLIFGLVALEGLTFIRIFIPKKLANLSLIILIRNNYTISLLIDVKAVVNSQSRP